ncbi:beta-lactamase family protein [Colletotrichum orchidophilum]|uniref:Beta-lactamase family protein n=1 Tax=Colletotrichum orchidophilum TaxID=1209926 RepID=A0A1G4ATV7_9PEZI|nr:beta-lactamase family protein [Colletotrichum orchidophilum]OHE92541.1 beta-lactamase family protein [Colletotrichum orchidophilum]
MSSFEDLIETAVRDGILPGVVLYAKDKSGQLDYAKVISPENTPHIPTLTSSSTLWLASATKLITTIAVLQLVERGKVTLDEDVAPHIPALASQQVLTGFTSTSDDDARPVPILEPRGNPLTLRHLLTHSAGTTYDFLSPDVIQRWQALNDITPISGANVEERFAHPLVYQPGREWSYSNSIDWAGCVVESVTGVDLETYLRTNIFEPLGLESFTFSRARVAGEEEAGEKKKGGEKGNNTLWPLSEREASTGRVIPHTTGVGIDLQRGVEAPLGGQGLYGRMDEYLVILHSLLLDDGRLLRPQTAAGMFRPQLGEASKKSLLEKMEDSSWTVGDLPPTREYDWAFGGLLVDGEAHPRRRPGTLIWGGAANIFWWIDRETGLAGVFGTQIMPAGEAVTRGYIKAFEDEMYSRVQSLKRGY